MIRRADTTVADELGTPEPGVYITVKDDTGVLATIYDDSGNLMANPFTSGLGGAFAYNISDTDQGTYTEEYRLSLSEGPRKTIVVDLSIGGAASVRSVPTRTALAALSNALPAYLTESGREGDFVWSSANLQTQVTADTMQGIYVPPTGGNGSTGARVRKSDNAPSVVQNGTVADNATNDASAVAAALSLAKALALPSSVGGGFGYSIGAGRVRIPKAANAYYQGTTTHDIYATTRIEGDSSGEAGGGSTVLRWGNATGFRVQRYNTTGDTGTDGTAAGTRGGDASIISGLFLKGSYVATEGSFHGAYLRARASLRDMTFDSWPGDAIRVDADSAGAFGVPVGNANNFEISRAFAQYCRNGIYARGGDVNVGVITGFSAIACRQWGVFDEGFLGSVYIGAHTAANGLAGDGTAAHPAAAATYLGNRFYVKVGQEVGASTNAPPATATSNTWWGFWQAGGAATGIVAWVTGLNWRAGGGYCTTSLSAAHVFLGCYSEMDQPPSQFSQNSLIIGGLHGAPVVGGGYIRANQNFVQVSRFWSEGYAKFDYPQTDFGPQSGTAADNFVNIDNTNSTSQITFRQWAAGVPTTLGFVRSTSGTVGMDLGVTSGAGTLRLMINNVVIGAVDSTGLTVTGKGAFSGLIKSSGTGGIGYATGAGASVTQITSKATTTPAINKDCGQIVTNNAALAAAAVVTFQVPNSEVAATDTINLNLASGQATEGTYRYWIEKVAAGSFKMSLENRSAGSLSEALTFNFSIVKAVAA